MVWVDCLPNQLIYNVMGGAGGEEWRRRAACASFVVTNQSPSALLRATVSYGSPTVDRDPAGARDDDRRGSLGRGRALGDCGRNSDEKENARAERHRVP